MLKTIKFIKLARLMACLFLFFSVSAHAKILKDEVSLIKETQFSFHEVCLEMTKRKAELIEKKSISKLDCMGAEVDVGKFCYKKMAHDPYYIRGVVSSTSKEIICKSAKKVILKYFCKVGSPICKDAELGCFMLQEKLAARLKLSHFSKNSNELNCYFSPKNDDYLKLVK